MIFSQTPLFKMMIFLLITVFVIGIIGTFISRPKKEKTLNNRKKQSLNLSEVKFIKDSADKINMKSNPYKKSKLETLLVQAGLDMNYGEFILISLILAIVSLIAMSTIFQNPLMGILFAFVGYGIPKQIVTLIRNSRIKKLERQVGSFMNMLIQRYKVTENLKKALDLTIPEFKNADLIYKELLITKSEAELIPVLDALKNLAFRTGNKFFSRMIDYYEAADSSQPHERIELMKQAYEQWNEDQTLKLLLKREISEPVRDAAFMTATIPVFAIYMSCMDENYLDFMLHHTVGKIGTTAIVATVIICIWIIVNKISAPLE